MYEWQRKIQTIVNEIDECIKLGDDEELTLRSLSRRLGYSEFYVTKKFGEISGMQFRDYIRRRKLAFALKEVRDSARRLLDIAVDHGFSSHEAFTRAFKSAYGITPSEYRKNPVPLVLRTKLNPFDRYFFGIGEIGMIKSSDDIKIYFVTLPAHKFMHIKSYESCGYWDFWEKQGKAGLDCGTVCGLLDSIGNKLDDCGGSEPNSGAGQIMGYLLDPNGKRCSYHGIPCAECYGVRLPCDYDGEVPYQMLLTDVPESEYIVFEHGPFDYEQENCNVEEKINKAMESFDISATEYRYDTSFGRIVYLYHDPERFWKEIRPVCKAKKSAWLYDKENEKN